MLCKFFLCITLLNQPEGFNKIKKKDEYREKVESKTSCCCTFLNYSSNCGAKVGYKTNYQRWFLAKISVILLSQKITDIRQKNLLNFLYRSQNVPVFFMFLLLPKKTCCNTSNENRIGKGIFDDNNQEKKWQRAVFRRLLLLTTGFP